MINDNVVTYYTHKKQYCNNSFICFKITIGAKYNNSHQKESAKIIRIKIFKSTC